MLDETTLQILIYAAIFLSVVLGAEALFNLWQARFSTRRRLTKRGIAKVDAATNEQVLVALRRRRQAMSETFYDRVLSGMENRLAQAGLTVSAKRMLAGMSLVTAVVGIIFPLFAGLAGQLTSFRAFFLLAVLAASVGFYLPWFYITRKAAKRLKLIEAQFPTALDVLVRGLRAGYPVSSAIEMVVREMPEPLSSELGLIEAEMSYGYPLRDALENFAERLQTPDAYMFAVSVSIQAETGGSLADILQGLSSVIRERASMVAKVRALASEGVATGAVLTGLPILSFAAIFALTPTYYLDVIDDPLFLPGMLSLLVLYIIGIVIMRRIIAIKV